MGTVWDEYIYREMDTDCCNCRILRFALFIFYDLLKSKEYSERRQFFKVILFLSGFLLLFYWANPYAIAVLMFCALLRAIYDIITIIVQQKNKITGSNMTVTERK